MVFVASFGRYGVPSEERGLFKSVDGGKTWKKVLYRDDKTGAVDVVIDRRNPSVMYAALWEAYRIEYQMSSGGPGSGLFKSTDGGDTWTEITRAKGLPAGVIGRIGIAVSGADSNRVYALIENENGGLYSSDDAGTTWKLVNAARSVRQRAFYYTHIAADPNSKDTVYLLNTSAFRSTDGGKTLANIGQGTHGDHHDIWIDPDNSEHVILGNDGGGAITYRVSAAAADVERSGLPDRAVLSRHHHGAPALPRLRRAAGQHHAVRGERHRPGRRLRPHPAGRALSGRWRRARLHRGRPAATRMCSSPARTTARSSPA